MVGAVGGELVDLLLKIRRERLRARGNDCESQYYETYLELEPEAASKLIEQSKEVRR